MRDCKSRTTIYLSADIVIHFKEQAEGPNIGYQTLINNALRKIVDGEIEADEKRDIKQELLQDEEFPRRLKTPLAA